MPVSPKKKIDIEISKAMSSYRGGKSSKAKVKSASALMMLGVLPLVTDDTKADQLLRMISQLMKEK